MTTKNRRIRKSGEPAPEGAPPEKAEQANAPRKPRRAAAASRAEPHPEKSRTGKPAGGSRKPEAGSPIARADEEAEDTGSEPLTPEVIAPEVIAPEVLPAEPGLDDDDGGATPYTEAETKLPVPLGRDLSRADALQRYLSEIARHPLLTREQEHELAVKFSQTREPQIAWRLVTANLRLVVKIANEYRRAAFSVLDLIQEGNVGLMQAVQKYDPFRGVKLSSYSAWWIRAYIIRYLMDNWRMVKLGTTQAQRKLFFNLRKEQEKLLAQGFEAEPLLLAEKLDVSEQDIREMDQRLGNDEFSLDTPLSPGGAEDSRQTYLDKLGDSANSGAEEQLGNEELRRVFRDKLAAFGRTLTGEKDRFLFEHRISVAEGEEPLTLQEVGAKYGFTRERARQLEARLTERLREYLRAELPDFAQLSVNAPEDE